MTPLPADLVGWRLDRKTHATTWNSGEGARIFGGRWNSRGRKTVYCSVDPATAILEVAVHKGFRVLDTEPHVLTCFAVIDRAAVHVVRAGAVPNPNWLRPGIPGAGQQSFGDALLAAHAFVLLPNVVSVHSWNLLFDADVAAGQYTLTAQEDFALDTRLHPAV